MSDWVCIVYAPEDAGCFLEAAAGPCGGLAECRARMAVERARLHRRLLDLAATDPGWADVAAAFPTPDRLLGGDR